MCIKVCVKNKSKEKDTSNLRGSEGAWDVLEGRDMIMGKSDIVTH